MKHKRDTPLFELGKTVATPAALKAAGAQAAEFIKRHASGSWEESTARERLQNKRAVRSGGCVLSRHTTKRGQVVLVSTEADRSVTALLLPRDWSRRKSAGLETYEVLIKPRIDGSLTKRLLSWLKVRK